MDIRADVFERMKADLVAVLKKDGVDHAAFEYEKQNVFIHYHEDSDELEVHILGKKGE